MDTEVRTVFCFCFFGLQGNRLLSHQFIKDSTAEFHYPHATSPREAFFF